jgi:hypothetical protein
MNRNNCLRDLLCVLFICIPLFAKTQQYKFIGGVLFDLHGIGLLGNSGQYWNSSSEKEGAGHGGISCGLFVKRDLNKNLYSLLEIRYSTKGSLYVYSSQYGTPVSESLYLDYIEFPLLFGSKLTTSNKKSFYLETGLSVAKLISSRIESNDTYSRPGTPNNEDFKSIDFLWIGSIKFPLIQQKSDKLLLGVIVSQSILPIHNEIKIYNFEYGIELNYLFN